MLFKKRKIGLCLSGGGLRAIVHLGVLQVIEEKNIKIDSISGTSAGAIIAALYARGYTTTEMMSILEQSTFFNRKTFKLQSGGLFSSSVLTDIYKKYLPINNFSSLKIPLTIAATDVNLGTIEYFSSGNLHEPLLATASIPFIFPSSNIHDHIFCDGGLLNNLPIEPLKKDCNFIIASHVNSVSTLTSQDAKKLSPKAMMERLYHIGMANMVNLKKQDCDVFIEPENLVQYSMFTKKNAQQLFTLGYEHASRALVEVK